MNDDIENSIKINLEELVNAKLERQKAQESELEKYSSYVKKNKLCEGAEIVFLWKKLVEELSTGRYIKYLESDTKDRIFKNYEFLILEAVNEQDENIYLTPIELINKIKEPFWNTIQSFCYPITNGKSPINDKLALDDLFIKKVNYYMQKNIREILHQERQKFLGYDINSTYGIRKNDKGKVIEIIHEVHSGPSHAFGYLGGSDEEKQKFGDEYENKWAALAKFEKIILENNK